MRRRKGFTLIELMIVVAIIGILAAIAIPNFLKFQCKSKQSEAKTNLSGIFTAEKSFFGEYNTFGTDLLSINWQPDGTPLYIYGFSAVSFCGSVGCVAGLPSYNGANKDTAVTSVVGNPPRYSTIKMFTLTATALANTNLPAAANVCDGGSFTAGASGDIDPDTTTQLDQWTINVNKSLQMQHSDCSKT